MTEHLNQIETYVDEEQQHRWRIQVTPGTPGGTEPDIIAMSPQGYANKDDMYKSLFRIFFAEWDDSFLAAYNDWHPEVATVHIDEGGDVQVDSGILAEAGVVTRGADRGTDHGTPVNGDTMAEDDGR